ncbi:S8 family serine peptidase [bacterium]|nr:S8 family serine peptidase [bacterium]
MKKQHYFNKNFFLIFYLIFFFLVFVFLFYTPFSNAETLKYNYVPNEILVQLKSNNRIYKITYPDKPDLKEIQKILLKSPDIKYAEPNYIFRISYLPNDTFYDNQWYLKKIRASQAWDITHGGSDDVIVAVIDTGVDINHPDLKNNIWTNKGEIPNDGIDNDGDGYIDDYHGWDFVSNSPDPNPKFNDNYTEAAIHHGTLVAGLIAATGDNGKGVIGVAYKTKIMPLRVLDSQGNGTVEAVIKAVDFAVEHRADVINLSFVGPNRSELLAQTLKKAWDKGVLIVAAGGNEANGQTENLDVVPEYPICLDENSSENFIIGVAATDENDRKADFSNFGRRCIDISAPGRRIFGTMVYKEGLKDYNEYYGGYWSGTSLAAPLVSGAAALLKSTNPLINNKKIRDILFQQSDNIDNLNPRYAGKLGKGRLNVYKAVRKIYLDLIKVPQSRYIVTGAGPGGGPHVKVVKTNGLTMSSFMAYDPRFRGGVNVSAGDVDGDGKEEIVTAPASHGGAHIRIFNFNGKLKYQFFALKKSWRGGLNVSTCDLNNDGKAEIIISKNAGLPYVYIFDYLGHLKRKFLAYAKNFRGPVKVACGDVDGDGINEIITGAGKGGGPHVRIFGPHGGLESQFFAFLKKFRGGINIAVGDVNGNGKDEIIVGIASNASPYVRIFDYFGFLKMQFLAFNRHFYHGVKLSISDLNNDGKAEIIVGAGKGGGPQVRIFNYYGDVRSQFFAYVKWFFGGVNVGEINAE